MRPNFPQQGQKNEVRIFSIRGFLLSGLLLGVIFLLSPISLLASAPFSTNLTFQEFLNHPPWIRHIYFRRSGTYFLLTAIYKNKTYSYIPPQWVPCEGALQPGGFYFRYAFDPSFCYRFDSVTRKFVRTKENCNKPFLLGLGRKYWWQFRQGGSLSVAPREPLPGSNPQNGREIICRQLGLNVLKEILHLGIPELVDASKIQWDETNRFSAVSPQYGKIQAVVTRWRGGYPLEIRYTAEKPDPLAQSLTKQPPPFFQIVRYEYKGSPSLPPWKIIRIPAKAKAGFTNIIEIAKLGLDPLHQDGYEPQEFLEKNQQFAGVFLYSNRIRYRIGKNGKLVPFIGKPGPKTIAQAKRQLGLTEKSPLLWIFLLVGTAIILPLTIWLVIRKTSKG